MKKSINHSMILTQKAVGLSKKIFERHKKIIIQYIGNKPGVYALYDEKELYYVGRSIDLARRVKYHLKDQHSALWTHFSVYFTKKAQYANDIEAVIISIAQPKGNKVKSKLGKDTKLEDFIKKAVKESHKEELRELGLGRKRQYRSGRQKNKARPTLKNYFEKNRPLRKTYKGKSYKAILLKTGKIKYKNKLYDSPSSVAKVIVHSSEVNGWNFWFIQNDAGNWVKLNELG